ncbi:MAG: hypothetical protein ACI8WB_005504 [Phenylobacterium sp.]|jgi:hypothetical protein
MTTQTLVPGLANPAANGFNMKDGDFLGAAIFELSYDQQNTVTYGASGNQQLYDVPDGLNLSTAVSTNSQSTAQLLATTADYDNTFSASISGSFSSISFSGSMASEVAFHGSLFQSINTLYTVNWDLEQVYTVERDTASLVLTEAFVQAIVDLSTTTPDSDDFKDFFNLYGTHYLVKGGFGGYMTMETSIEDSLYETNTEEYISSQVEAAYSGVTGSGNMSASVAVSSSEFFSENQDLTSIYIATNGGQRQDTINEYFETIFDLPILLITNPSRPFDCTPISELVILAGGSETLQSQLENEIGLYIDSAVIKDGVLLSPQPRNSGQAYKAGQDGFLLTVLNADVPSSAVGARVSTLSYSDSDPSPSQLEGAAAVHYYPKSDSYVPWASSTVPVKAQDYYRVMEEVTALTPQVESVFFALELSALHSPVPVSSYGQQTPDYDGFVFSVINYTTNGDRGYLEIAQQLTSTEVIKTGTSMHYYTPNDEWVLRNSCCMPVKKGIPYTISAVATAGAPSFTSYYCAMDGDTALQNASERIANTVYQAETDGFLVGYLDMAVDGDRSQLSVYTNLDADLIKEQPPIALTSMHYYEHSDNRVPKSSVMVPIGLNEYYSCDVIDTAGSANHYIYFVPLVKRTS